MKKNKECLNIMKYAVEIHKHAARVNILLVTTILSMIKL